VGEVRREMVLSGSNFGPLDTYINLMHNMHVSPTVAHYKSIRFMIRTNDHPPPHVHAIKDDCEAVVEIQTGKVIRSRGFSAQDLTRISIEILTTRDLLQEEWDAIHEE
jgi:hypothetical protein